MLTATKSTISAGALLLFSSDMAARGPATGSDPHGNIEGVGTSSGSRQERSGSRNHDPYFREICVPKPARQRPFILSRQSVQLHYLLVVIMLVLSIVRSCDLLRAIRFDLKR
jgi:hypothetical protein